jgi:hypothetical protein
VSYYVFKYPKTYNYNHNNIYNIRHFSINTLSTDLDEKIHIKPIKTYTSSNEFSYTAEDKKIIYKETKNKISKAVKDYYSKNISKNLNRVVSKETKAKLSKLRF